MLKNINKKLSNIENIILDIDGVITNGKMFILENNKLLRSINSKDGFAICLAAKKGIKIFVITGSNDNSMPEHLKELGVIESYINCRDKTKELNEIVSKYKINLNRTIYMGDDIMDIPVLQEVGISSCPKDACIDVLNMCDYISNKNGGEGCVRDIIEKILKLQGKWI